ncbi:hypothetical protein Sste5346_008758 [Sporothrix stenoceras]|uniref:Zn(2)-C6 fungal-type domain-containing protein n=1 Tax=Sporothrix stenoceras TaxID=5173 RepID=A0ABR3YQH7_9PEZI
MAGFPIDELTSCWTCRERKVKCDEQTPSCHRCTHAGRDCTYAVPPGRLKRVLKTPSVSTAASPGSVASPVAARGTPAITSPLSSATNDDATNDHIIRYYKEQYLSFLMTKSPEWSFVSGIVYLGRTNSAVMSLIMANVQFQASGVQLLPPSPHDYRLQALQHYQSGLHDFSALVASREYDPLTLLSALFLLVQFELRHSDHVDGITSHLQAFGAAILAYGGSLIPGLRRDDESPNIPYHNVLNRLGLWLVYMDAVASTWDLGGAVLDGVLSSFPPATLDRVFSESREAGQEIWGASYPTAEALDDLQNRPAFDLYHAAHLLRYNVARYRRAVNDQTQEESTEGLQQTIEEMIAKLYRDHNLLLQIAAQWPERVTAADAPTPTSPVSRIVLNLHFIVPFFLASVVEFDCIVNHQSSPTSPSSSPPSASLPRTTAAINDIINIAAIVHETEQPNAMCRLAWPLFVATTSAPPSTSFAHQSWILGRFAALSQFGTNYSRAHSLLKEVIREQRITGSRVPYRQWIKDKFIL